MFYGLEITTSPANGLCNVACSEVDLQKKVITSPASLHPRCISNKKLYFYEIRSQLPLMLTIFPMNYKINFAIFEMIRPQKMFFRKCHSLSSCVLCANPAHNYPN